MKQPLGAKAKFKLNPCRPSQFSLYIFLADIYIGEMYVHIVEPLQSLSLPQLLGVGIFFSNMSHVTFFLFKRDFPFMYNWLTWPLELVCLLVYFPLSYSHVQIKLLGFRLLLATIEGWWTRAEVLTLDKLCGKRKKDNLSRDHKVRWNFSSSLIGFNEGHHRYIFAVKRRANILIIHCRFRETGCLCSEITMVPKRLGNFCLRHSGANSHISQIFFILLYMG